ncbi:MAG: hypothetical protein ACHQAY_27670, partial [Hyphomicrobiales bacterium]
MVARGRPRGADFTDLKIIGWGWFYVVHRHPPPDVVLSGRVEEDGLRQLPAASAGLDEGAAEDQVVAGQ